MANFNIIFDGTPEQFAAKAGGSIKDKNGMFEGSPNTGKFGVPTLIGRVEGNYATAPAPGNKTTVSVTITKKPLVVSVNKIKETISGFLD